MHSPSRVAAGMAPSWVSARVSTLDEHPNDRQDHRRAITTRPVSHQTDWSAARAALLSGGLLQVELTALSRGAVPREGCRYAEEVPAGVQAGSRHGRSSR